MAQRKPKDRVTLQQVLKLVDQLSADDVLELNRRLNDKTWGQRYQRLTEQIAADRSAKGLPNLTEEEIMSEVKAVREEMKSEREHQSRS